MTVRHRAEDLQSFQLLRLRLNAGGLCAATGLRLGPLNSAPAALACPTDG